VQVGEEEDRQGVEQRKGRRSQQLREAMKQVQVGEEEDRQGVEQRKGRRSQQLREAVKQVGFDLLSWILQGEEPPPLQGEPLQDLLALRDDAAAVHPHPAEEVAPRKGGPLVVDTDVDAAMPEAVSIVEMEEELLVLLIDPQCLPSSSSSSALRPRGWLEPQICWQV
ncbi:hypothetical protein Taro_044607, partial [Colocasia esculenta]|nr:hypothetical protein [Colocasia esculenta]